MIELKYKFKRDNVAHDVEVRLFDVNQARDDEGSAPWDVTVTISWAGRVAFNRQLAGMDPLHAIHLAAQFAANYLHGRAADEGGILEPTIFPFWGDQHTTASAGT